MDHCGVILRDLRLLNELSVRKTAQIINRSTGWLSELENQCGTAKISEKEFSRIIAALNGQRHFLCTVGRNINTPFCSN